MESRPNVVLVVADDMGYGDVAVLNADSRIPTPHMSRIAEEGMTFTDAHSASAVCTPSRYSILTGRYSWRSRLPKGVFTGYEPPLIEQDRLTVASMLKASGYETGAFGKWHLGLGFSALPEADIDFERPLPWTGPDRAFEESIDFNARLTGGPLELGFETFFGTACSSTSQPPYGWIDGDRFVDPPTDYQETHQYTGRPGMMSKSWDHREVDTVIADKTIEFIDDVDDDAPFFAYVALSSPHEPCTTEVTPQFAVGRSDAGPRGDLVWLVDHVIGRIDEALERKGVKENTLLIITSDNGALAGDRVINAEGDEEYRTYGHLSNGHWRGHKAHIWEGGHREPLIMRWPGRIPAGQRSDALVCLSDLLATIASIVEFEIPDGAGEDSFDLSAVISGTTTQSERDTLISHSQRGVFAVRRGPWKAIFGTKGSGGWPPPSGGEPVAGSPGQLYNLEDDPLEAEDLWDTNQEVVAELQQLLEVTLAGDRTVVGS